ncbi:hypothetical protein MHF_0629 [Mycoplasma haemofelis Ohio2]|uniref:Uncharacterized protein n=1 Tax=Mycoplasma haemofelis (strain Ohio2) TaxID=859194 RepID=F6FI53_MYCHI|nr:hypothetical protein MHF_0629 [Mycoplasma haemofelis Ohio2]
MLTGFWGREEIGMIESKYLALGGAGLAGAGAAGGLALGTDLFSSKSDPKSVISKVLEKSLIPLGEDHSSKWNDRKTKLESAESGSLIPSLEAIKTKENRSGEDIKNWCKDNVGGFVEDDGGKKFKNVSNYCTFNIKDKLTNPVSDSNWTTVNDKLKGIESGLSPAMEKVKSELNKGGGDANALKSWCESTYTKMFIGSDDASFKDASSHCTSTN